MCIKSGSTEFLSNGETHFFHPKHYGSITHGASVWLVSCKTEYISCNGAIFTNYVEEDTNKNKKLAYNLVQEGNSFAVPGAGTVVKGEIPDCSLVTGNRKIKIVPIEENH